MYHGGMLEVGVSLEQTRVVRRDDCITFLGADVRPSLATPRMIHWMEICCRDAILPHLEAGSDSVGVRVDVEHLAATPMGQGVTYRAKVVGLDGRRVRFEVEARAGSEAVGRGTHERFVVDVQRFAARLRKQFGEPR